MIVLEEAGTTEQTDLRELNPEELASRIETTHIVSRLTRKNELNGDSSEAVRVAAFNSFI